MYLGNNLRKKFIHVQYIFSHHNFKDILLFLLFLKQDLAIIDEAVLKAHYNGLASNLGPF